MVSSRLLAVEAVRLHITGGWLGYYDNFQTQNHDNHPPPPHEKYTSFAKIFHLILKRLHNKITDVYSKQLNMGLCGCMVVCTKCVCTWMLMHAKQVNYCI